MKTKDGRDRWIPGNKERRLHGYPYRHSSGGWITWWDTYGDIVMPSVSGGEWHLVKDEEVGLYLTEGNDI